MSRGRKSRYPERPVRKSQPKSSQSGGGKRKWWVSDRSIFDGRMDQSPRMHKSWCDAPIYKDARLERWGVKA